VSFVVGDRVQRAEGVAPDQRPIDNRIGTVMSLAAAPPRVFVLWDGDSAAEPVDPLKLMHAG
jgi:hypothetical protein